MEATGEKGGTRCGSWRQLGVTALCAAVVFSILYEIKELFPFGDGSIVMTDLYSQYVPLLYRFYDVVCGEKNLFLEFGISGGANLYVDTINEVLNPFNYVLLFFGRDMIYKAVNVVLLLYVTASAAAAHYFLLQMFPGKKKWNTVLSLSYALSGYLAYDFQIIKWMYFPVLFPLFLLALLRLLQKKKGGAYAVLLAYQLVLSIQLGFMTLLFTLFAGGIWFFMLCPKQDRQEGMRRLSVYTIIGLLLSAAVWIPNVLVLLSSSRAGENLSYFGVMKRHGLDDLFERLFVAGNPVLAGMAAALGLERLREGKLRRRKVQDDGTQDTQGTANGPGTGRTGRFLVWLNAFLWLTVLLQPANLLWHMGSYVCFPVRYGYMVLLCMVWLVKWMLVQREEKGRSKEAENPGKADSRSKEAENPGKADSRSKEAECRKTGKHFAVAALAAVLCLTAIGAAAAGETQLVQAFGSLAISSTCPKETLLVCGILALFFAAAFSVQLCRTDSAPSSGLQKQQNGTSWQSVLTGAMAAACGLTCCLMIFLPADSVLRKENEEAYRKMVSASRQAAETIFERKKEESGQPLNAALVSRQNSLSGYIPTADRQYKQALEQLGYLVPWVATQSVGGTAVSDALLSEGLVLDRAAEELQEQAAGKTVLERQEALTVAAAGRSLLQRFVGTELETDADGVIHLLTESRQRLYLDLNKTASEFVIYVNGEQITVPEEAAGVGPHRLVELGSFEKKEVEICVTDRNGAVLPTQNMELGALDETLWQDFWNNAKQNGIQGRREGTQIVPDDRIAAQMQKGRVTVTLPDTAAGQTLFLPLAALDGWKCVENGKAVDIATVFDGFMGITCAEGSSEIVLRFLPPGLVPGLVLSAAGLAVWLGDWSLRRRKSRLGEAFWGGLYRIVLAGGAVGMYLVPAVGLAAWLIAKVLGLAG